MATRYPKWPRSDATSATRTWAAGSPSASRSTRVTAAPSASSRPLVRRKRSELALALMSRTNFGASTARVAPAITRVSTCCRPSPDPSSATVLCSSASLASRSLIFMSARLASASRPCAASQRKRAEQQASPSHSHDSWLISATENPKSWGNVEAMPSPNAQSSRNGSFGGSIRICTRHSFGPICSVDILKAGA